MSVFIAPKKCEVCLSKEAVKDKPRCEYCAKRFGTNGDPYSIFCDIYGLYKKGRQIYLWSMDNVVVKTPIGFSQLLGMSIKPAIAELKGENFKLNNESNAVWK